MTKKQILKDLMASVQSRTTKNCPFFEYNNTRIVYKRYAALYFVIAQDFDDNEILALEIIQRYVELLDKYFSNVCELDIIFHFQKAYYILDEFILNGEVIETSKERVLKVMREMDQLQQKENNNGQSPATSTS